MVCEENHILEMVLREGCLAKHPFPETVLRGSVSSKYNHRNEQICTLKFEIPPPQEIPGVCVSGNSSATNVGTNLTTTYLVLIAKHQQI